MTQKKENQEVVIITNRNDLRAGEVQLHNKDFRDSITRSLKDFKKDWKIITNQITEILDSTDEKIKSKNNFEIEEIEIALGFNGKGKIAFLAEAGAEASIKILIKKNSNPE